jgi:flagellar M-ring protein FliF
VVGAVIGGAIFLGVQPDYSPLYSQLKPGDAGAILDEIKTKKIPYKLTAGGSQILVPSAKIYELRLDMAGKGLPKGDGAGFELFDKMSFGITDQVQQINYTRALQSELERTIDTLDSVAKSRVHLAMPKDDLWLDESAGPTAAVMISLQTGGVLRQAQIDSIRHLVASAVTGLDPQRVTIVDTQGRIMAAAGESALTGGLSDQQIEYKKKIEERMREQAQSLLIEILGPGKAAIRVNAEMNFDQKIMEREYFTPVVGKSGLVRNEKQQSVQPVKEGEAAGGAAGTAANLQGYPPSGAVARLGTQKNERETKYEMNRTVERVTSASGAIQKLTVGVFIDGELEGTQLGDIQAVLSQALGINLERGDKIEVKAIPFNREDAERERALLEKSERERALQRVLTEWVPKGLLAVVAAWFLWMTFTNMKKYAEQIEVEKKQARPALTAEGEGMQSTEQIIALIKDRPNETAAILKDWVS